MAPNSIRASNRPLVLIKLGGSIITHKDGYCESNAAMIRSLGLSIRSIITDYSPVVVLGGGSFGNRVPQTYGLLSPTKRLQDIAMMTITMQKWIFEFTAIWRDLGLSLMPFQSSALVFPASDTYSFVSHPLINSLVAGLIPILSGDLIVHPNKTIEIFSSDKILVLLSKSFKFERIIVLTDVNGVQYQGMLVDRIDQSNIKRILTDCGPSRHPDITGGMGTKVKAVWESVQEGSVAVICNGREENILVDLLLHKKRFGTIVEVT